MNNGPDTGDRLFQAELRAYLPAPVVKKIAWAFDYTKAASMNGTRMPGRYKIMFSYEEDTAIWFPDGTPIDAIIARICMECP